MSSISVIICTKNRHADLANALTSLAQQTHQPDEVIIVDASQQAAPPTIHQLLQEFAAHKYLRTAPGLPTQRNRGIDQSHGDLVFFFDDDVLLEADYVAQIARVFEQDQTQRYGGGMGQIYPRRRRAPWLHRLLAQIFMLGTSGGSGRLRLSGFVSFPHGTQVFKEVEALSGCCMVYRRKALQNHHFDETLGGYAYMEDVDLSYRVSREYALFYEPAARLHHLSSPTARGHQRLRAKMLVCNHHYLFKKNFPQTFQRRLAHAWSLFGLAVRMILYRSPEGLLGVVDGWCTIIAGTREPAATQNG